MMLMFGGDGDDIGDEDGDGDVDGDGDDDVGDVGTQDLQGEMFGGVIMVTSQDDDDEIFLGVMIADIYIFE